MSQIFNDAARKKKRKYSERNDNTAELKHKIVLYSFGKWEEDFLIINSNVYKSNWGIPYISFVFIHSKGNPGFVIINEQKNGNG